MLCCCLRERSTCTEVPPSTATVLSGGCSDTPILLHIFWHSLNCKKSKLLLYKYACKRMQRKMNQTPSFPSDHRDGNRSFLQAVLLRLFFYCGHYETEPAVLTQVHCSCCQRAVFFPAKAIITFTENSCCPGLGSALSSLNAAVQTCMLEIPAQAQTCIESQCHRIIKAGKDLQDLKGPPQPTPPCPPTVSPGATSLPLNTSRDGNSPPTSAFPVAVPDHSLEKKLFLIPTLDLPLGNMRPSLLIMVPFTVLIMQRMARQQHGASNICSPSLPCVPTSVSGIWVPEPLDTSVRLRKREK